MLRPRFVLLGVIASGALAAGCSKHPSYGTVQPRDTANVQPPPKFQEPRPGQDPAK